MPIELMTTAQVAARLGRDTRTIHRMVDDHRLVPLAKLPGETGAYLFSPGEVDRVASELAKQAEVA